MGPRPPSTTVVSCDPSAGIATRPKKDLTNSYLTEARIKRHRRLVQSKHRQLNKLDCQIRDIKHKLTRGAVSDLLKAGVKEFVIGDLRSLRRNSPFSQKATASSPTKGKVFNQRIHQAPLGKTRDYLTYKCRREGNYVADPISEHRTTMNAPNRTVVER